MVPLHNIIVTFQFIIYSENLNGIDLVTYVIKISHIQENTACSGWVIYRKVIRNIIRVSRNREKILW